MFGIETFTAQPDYFEDRIRLDTLSPEGETQSIYLTRRLSDRFVPLLVERIELQARPGAPKDIVLAMSQQQLRIERDASPIPDVEPQQGASRWLCQTIHLSEEQGAVLWTLTDDAANTAVMLLAGEDLRGVLEVMLLTYRRLEWGLEVFPLWLLEEGAGSVEAPGMLN
jgi:hypothetical protein